jgi:hypothetical protein
LSANRDLHFLVSGGFSPNVKISLPGDVTYHTMANIAYFQISVDDITRARKFFLSLPGWKIEPDTTLEDKTLQ